MLNWNKNYAWSLFLTAFLFLLSEKTWSHTEQYPDTINKILKMHIHDTSKCNLINALIENEYDVTIWPLYNEALKELVAEGEKKSVSNKDLQKFFKRQWAVIHGNQGYLEFYHKSNIQEAIRNFSTSLGLDTELGFEPGIANDYNSLGMLYQQLGDQKKSLDFYYKSVRIAERLNNTNLLSIIYTNIGGIFVGQKEYEKALEYYNKALKFRTDAKNIDGIANSYNAIGFVYSAMEKNEIAEENYLKALELVTSIGDKMGMATIYNNLGSIYSRHYINKTCSGDESCKNKYLKRALEYYNKSLPLHEEVGDLHGVVKCLCNISTIDFYLKNYGLAKSNSERAYQIAKKLNYPELIVDAALHLYQVEYQLGNYKSAYNVMEEYYTMRDSLNNKERLKASLQQQMKYEYDKLAIADSVKSANEKKVIEARLEEEKIRNYALIGGLLLIGIFTIILYNRFKITKSQKDLIELKEKETQLQKLLVEKKQEEILDSITYAKRIQSAILPSARLVKEYLPDSFILYKPKDIVAGDFYWMEEHKGHILFAAADCTGHGVPGAMVSVICHNALNRSVKEFGLTDPGQILDKTREIVIHEFEKSEEDVKDGMDISLCVYSPKSRQLLWAGANNPLWIIRANTETDDSGSPIELVEIKPNKQPIGKFADSKPFLTHHIQLYPGDLVYVFTDGYQDQFGGQQGKKFKALQMKQMLVQMKHLSMEGQKKEIDSRFEGWRGTLEQIDDVCIIGLKV